MKNKLSIFLAVLIFSSAVLTAQSLMPEPAQKILEQAYKEAASSNKPVFLIFHATWCSWCKRLDKAMNSDDLKKIFEDHFVITHLDVLERGEKIQTDENPGGKEIMNKLGGEKSGLPFFAFLDSKGNKLADSNVMPKDQNIGYPGAKEEIEAFVKLLKKSSSKITDKELSAVTEYLEKNAPKPIQH